MIQKTTVFVIFCILVSYSNAQSFRYGNALYVNLNQGEQYSFKGVSVKVLAIENTWTKVQIDQQEKWLNVARRELPLEIAGIRVFVADHKNLKALTTDDYVHQLLTKDVILCLSDASFPLLDTSQFTFPIARSDGFEWSMEEDSHLFAYLGLSEWIAPNYYRSHEGMDISLHQFRGKKQSPVVAIEDGTITLAVDSTITGSKDGCITLRSSSDSTIYYIYRHTLPTTHQVKVGDEVNKGQILSHIWGDNRWGHLHFAVVKREDMPDYEDRYTSTIGFFPQMFELYNGSLELKTKLFTEGNFEFGQFRWLCDNSQKLDAFNTNVGFGWNLGRWSKTGKVERVRSAKGGNARLWKTLHQGTPAASTNPENFYEFSIQVENGLYQVDLVIGDLELPTAQIVMIENKNLGIYRLLPGDFKPLSQESISVEDNLLTIRLELVDPNICAGISQLSFVKIEK